MKDKLYSCFWVFVITLICTLGAMAVWGCAPHMVAPTPPPPNLIAHPLDATAATVGHLRTVLTVVNVVSFVVFLGSVGLAFVSALSWLSRIICPIAGTTAAGSLIGVIALPFTPWVVLGLVGVGLALGGYELYTYFKSKPATPPQAVTLVHQ